MGEWYEDVFPPTEKERLQARIRELEELYRASQGLLLEANLSLQRVQADAWDEGYEARVGFMDLRNETRAENNPYRETSNGGRDD